VLVLAGILLVGGALFGAPVASHLLTGGFTDPAADSTHASNIIDSQFRGGQANLVFLVSAWTYNLGLKRTPASVLPYIVSFGLLPAIVTLARSEPAGAAPWAIALGALLGVAAHFANVLPDLDDDAATGVRGLPHRIGRRVSGIATYLVLAVASVVAFAGLGGIGLGGAGWLQLAGLVLSLGIAATGILLVLTRPPSRLLFRLIIAAALVDVALLATAGERLLA